MKTTSEIETKTKTDSLNNYHSSVYKMWNDFIKSHPNSKNEELPEVDFFHNNKYDADRLTKLTVEGEKTAFSGLLSLYSLYDVDLPTVDSKQILTDFDGNAKVIIITTNVTYVPFNKISKEYAAKDMGTQIEPLLKWKNAHWNFFESFLKLNNQEATDDMVIVCVEFKTVWTLKD